MDVNSGFGMKGYLLMHSEVRLIPCEDLLFKVSLVISSQVILAASSK